jgi:hypothetical protein
MRVWTTAFSEVFPQDSSSCWCHRHSPPIRLSHWKLGGVWAVPYLAIDERLLPLRHAQLVRRQSLGHRFRPARIPRRPPQPRGQRDQLRGRLASRRRRAPPDQRPTYHLDNYLHTSCGICRAAVRPVRRNLFPLRQPRRKAPGSFGALAHQMAEGGSIGAAPS